MPPSRPIGLDEATQLEGGNGLYSTRLSDAWEIWGPSGGYLAAIALRAAGRDAQIPRPASFYCHFLSPPAFDEVELTVDVLRMHRGTGIKKPRRPTSRRPTNRLPRGARRMASRSSASGTTSVAVVPARTRASIRCRRSSGNGFALSRLRASTSPSSTPPAP